MAPLRRPPDSGLAERRRRYDIVTHSPEETLAFGRELAPLLKPPCLVLLEGELGSGKTVLTKGIVAGLGAAPESEVTSPTFALVHEYSGASKAYHLDLYRIEGLRDLATLGLDEMLLQEATVLVEWGDRWKPHSPLPRVEVRLEHCGGRDRHIVVDEVRQGFHKSSHSSSIGEGE
ncbi:MAG TPA: tRNA (adenosine(37)-N6)-threonylcarbamoyltransferase complex ATPase subunit type 1 TsaE [Terriglobia bacterium]|nr:tRNA (adenosine(37)-N6)-threonylcarbamoyltransferase complex ATPase subunit type 1 TsaE [Terriglobia bacterium]